MILIKFFRYYEEKNTKESLREIRYIFNIVWKITFLKTDRIMNKTLLNNVNEKYTWIFWMYRSGIIKQYLIYYFRLKKLILFFTQIHRYMTFIY